MLWIPCEPAAPPTDGSAGSSSQGTVVRKKRAMGIVGIGEESISLLPIDNSGKMGRFMSAVCPLGLLSNSVRVVRAPIEMRGMRANQQRVGWSQSVIISEDQTRAVGSKHIEILKEKNRHTATIIPCDHKSGTSSLNRVPGGIKTGLHADTPSELVVHEYGRNGYQTRIVKVNDDGTIDGNSHAHIPRISLDHVATAMDKLQQDMHDQQVDIEGREDDLAARYLSLESNAFKLGTVEYEKRLNALEKERVNLSKERAILQETFSLRVDSIQAQHDEATQRLLAQEEEHFANLAKAAEHAKKSLSPTRGDTKTVRAIQKMGGNKDTGRVGATRSTMKDAQSPLTDPEAVKRLHRGWISNIGSKQSHNVFLQKQVIEATTAVQDLWTPPKYKKGSRDAKLDGPASPFSASAKVTGATSTMLNSSLGLVACMASAVRTVEDDSGRIVPFHIAVTVNSDKAWNNFLKKLRVASERWRQMDSQSDADTHGPTGGAQSQSGMSQSGISVLSASRRVPLPNIASDMQAFLSYGVKVEGKRSDTALSLDDLDGDGEDKEASLTAEQKLRRESLAKMEWEEYRSGLVLDQKRNPVDELGSAVDGATEAMHTLKFMPRESVFGMGNMQALISVLT